MEIKPQGRIFTDKHRVNLSLAMKGKPKSVEHRRKCGLANLGNRLSEKQKGEIRDRVKRQWQDPEFKNKTVKAIRLGALVTPNKPETIIMGMLESICPGEFKFVGDGQVIIAGKNPDFININGQKQIIEMFGDYWHSNSVVKSHDRTEKGRAKLFKQYGFDTLIIWESELRNPNKVAARITSFTKKNCFDKLLGWT